MVADAASVVEIKSNWNVIRMLRMAPHPLTMADERTWLASHAGEWRAGTAYRFAVTIAGSVIGCADVDDIAEGSGSFGYWFGEPWWSQGYATEAGEAVMRFAFDQVSLAGLTSGRAADNPASGRVLEKLGFKRTGEISVWSKPRGCSIRQVTYALRRDQVVPLPERSA
ncbi:MAG: GNAT family N-acetyltransferase [Proteobacteria bacterium]|nr:GNAT family N-acetyltransferase [Pseudomonadota bacterium]MBI3500059.1 GNAT family N-acetyltransferase [Pseudomonadota bacterium]